MRKVVELIVPASPRRLIKTMIQRGRSRRQHRRRSLGYVEDVVEPRTKLEAVFSILLRFGAAEARITIARLG